LSQAGIVDIESSHPQIPTSFVTNSGTAIPIANTLQLTGSAVAAHGVPLQTVGSGNTVTIDVQYASAAASSVASNAGVASFNSADFTVDANGFVSSTGGGASLAFEVDAFTGPGTNPVVATGAGLVTITGGQVAAGTTTNVIRTDSLAANTYTIQVQRSQAVGSSTVGDNGVCHFNSSQFTVDSNGFVALVGGGTGGITWQTITASQTLGINNGYICIASGGNLSLALPSTSVVGALISIILDGSTSFTITQGAGQSIQLASRNTTTGTGGSLATTQQGDSVSMVCSVANLRWNIFSSTGNLTII
jgi:hypothetical protein